MLNKGAICSSDNATALFAGISYFVAHNGNSSILDSGASDYMTHDLSLFHYYIYVSFQDHIITIPDDRKVHVQFIGTICLNNGVELREVLYVLEFHFNMISISKLCQDLSF